MDLCLHTLSLLLAWWIRIIFNGHYATKDNSYVMSLLLKEIKSNIISQIFWINMIFFKYLYTDSLKVSTKLLSPVLYS